jgi:hypothetical protein
LHVAGAMEAQPRSSDSGLERRREGTDRRRTVTDDLYTGLTERGESFWTTVHPLFMTRDISRAQVREIVHRGLQVARGNYRVLTRLFNMPSSDYKRFLNFLRKHGCLLPFMDYR